MFKIGDYVTHYKEGVCEVIDIGKLDMRCSDRKKEYYTLRPLYDAGGTLYMPVANERNQIRGVITYEEARALIEDIPNIEVLWVTDEKSGKPCIRKRYLRISARNGSRLSRHPICARWTVFLPGKINKCRR